MSRFCVWRACDRVGLGFVGVSAEARGSIAGPFGELRRPACPPNGSGVVVCSWIAQHVFYLCLSDALLACCLLFVACFFPSLPFLYFFLSLLSVFLRFVFFGLSFVYSSFKCFFVSVMSITQFQSDILELFVSISPHLANQSYQLRTGIAQSQYLILQCSL